MLSSQNRFSLKTDRFRVESTGKTRYSSLLTIISAPRPDVKLPARFTILASKKSFPLSVNRHRLRRYLTEIIRHDDLVFDIGANTGTMTDIFLSRGARVIAVEPIPEYARHITAHFPSVTVINKAVSPTTSLIIYKSGTLSTAVPREWWTGRFAHIKSNDTIQCATTTLDALILEYGTPRYIKIDCEGYDATVISTLHSADIYALSFEYLQERHSHALNTLEQLTALNFSHFNLMWGGMHPYFDDYLPYSDFLSAFHDLRYQMWGDIVCLNTQI